VLWRQGFGAGQAGSTAVTSNPVTPVTTGPLGALPEPLRLASLEPNREAPAVERNLFRFGQPPAPPPPPPAPPAPPVTAPPPRPSQPTGPPAIPLELVGIWAPESGGAKWASLRNATTKATFQVFEGGIVDGRYKLVTIQERSVVVTYLDGSGRRSIPLVGGGRP
jgi:hypothetical protein